MDTSFLITGATGHIGSAVLDQLVTSASDTIIIATHHQNALRTTERWLDFERPESFGDALHQIDVLFLLRPPQLADVKRYFVPFTG